MNRFAETRAVRRAAVLLVPTLVALAAAGCSGDAGTDFSALGGDTVKAAVTVSGQDGAPADPARPITVTARDGVLSDVRATDRQGRVLDGALNRSGTVWTSTGPVAAGAEYAVRAETVGGDGSLGRREVQVRTAEAKRQLKAELTPEQGAEVGVGQPVVAELSLPVEDRAGRRAVEAGLRVESSKPVTGAWHWVDDDTLHYRPAEYWPAHTAVTVRNLLGGARIAEGLYGAPGKSRSFEIGPRTVAKVDVASHVMSVHRDGKLLRTVPISAGKPGFSTRNGVKVVLAKESYVRMRGTSIGIAAGSSESYDLPVYWATRVTWSGEYLHAAPWSAASHGVRNSSHGCVGMSTGNARWYFNNVRQGDVVEVVGSAGSTMEPFGNGFGDWNMAWDEWRKGSALHGPAPEAGAESGDETATVRPVHQVRPFV